MMLHVHKHGTDAPTFEDVANNFVGEKEIRKQLFGKIFANDIYPKQVLCFVKVNTNGELNDRTKGVVEKCSDLTCTKEVRFNRRTEAGGAWEELTWATRSAIPPKSFYACYEPFNLAWVGLITLHQRSSMLDLNAFFLGKVAS